MYHDVVFTIDLFLLLKFWHFPAPWCTCCWGGKHPQFRSTSCGICWMVQIRVFSWEIFAKTMMNYIRICGYSWIAERLLIIGIWPRFFLCQTEGSLYQGGWSPLFFKLLEPSCQWYDSHFWDRLFNPNGMGETRTAHETAMPYGQA
jgi:hypothetical protein